jgi:hypothetical protein
MPLEPHPTDPDKMVYKPHPAALALREEFNKDLQIAELTRERDDALRLLGLAHLNLRQHLEYGFNPKTAKSTLISVGRIAPLLHEAINKESGEER